jgi:NADH-quinone oxidoreductase subunit J
MRNTARGEAMYHLLFQQVIFYIFAALAAGSALMVVTLNNPVRCVLFLVLAFISTAFLWMLAYAEFLALVLVLVYVGAVMTLFLFVVMMLDIDIESNKSHFVRYLPLGILVLALLVSMMFVAITPEHFSTASIVARTTPKMSNTEALGMVLYTDYVLAFEIAAVILLVAIISAITLAHRKIKRSKQQDIVKQIMTRREDRVELIKMKSEK